MEPTNDSVKAYITNILQEIARIPQLRFMRKRWKGEFNRSAFRDLALDLLLLKTASHSIACMRGELMLDLMQNWVGNAPSKDVLASMSCSDAMKSLCASANACLKNIEKELLETPADYEFCCTFGEYWDVVEEVFQNTTDKELTLMPERLKKTRRKKTIAAPARVCS